MQHSIEIAVAISQIALLVWAAGTDIISRTVPNRISAALLLLGLAKWPVIGTHAMLVSLIAATVVFIVLYILWSLNLLGGADVKLLVALTVGLPLLGMVPLFVITVLSGGLLAILCAIKHRSAHGYHLPYAVAIACGGIWTTVNIMGA